MAKLTAADEKILRNPPSTETWICGREYEVLEIADGAPAKVKYPCPGVNSGSSNDCLWCQKPRRRGVKLLWPLYLAACARAKIAPGTRWPMALPTSAATTPPRPTKRKGA